MADMNQVIRKGFGKQQPARRTDSASDKKLNLEELSTAEHADLVEGLVLDLEERVGAAG